MFFYINLDAGEENENEIREEDLRGEYVEREGREGRYEVGYGPESDFMDTIPKNTMREPIGDAIVEREGQVFTVEERDGPVFADFTREVQTENLEGKKIRTGEFVIADDDDNDYDVELS